MMVNKCYNNLILNDLYEIQKIVRNSDSVQRQIVGIVVVSGWGWTDAWLYGVAGGRGGPARRIHDGRDEGEAASTVKAGKIDG
jgi:hypothetical protein